MCLAPHLKANHLRMAYRFTDTSSTSNRVYYDSEQVPRKLCTPSASTSGMTPFLTESCKSLSVQLEDVSTCTAWCNHNGHLTTLHVWPTSCFQRCGTPSPPPCNSWHVDLDIRIDHAMLTCEPFIPCVGSSDHVRFEHVLEVLNRHRDRRLVGNEVGAAHPNFECNNGSCTVAFKTLPFTTKCFL